jgi:aryl-alcohol dehydrogenase-like predicted oxidoreductase
MPARRYLPGISLSIVGFGGLMLQGVNQTDADRLVAESVAQGVNLFDSAPSYEDGCAEKKLGSALESYRKEIFLSCKTMARSAASARRELEQSLRRLRTGHFDLYQFHAVNTAKDVESIFAPGGAMEALLRAREEGLVRFLGFSSHSVPLALVMLNRFHFDSMLFPVNYVCYARGNFGPQVLGEARAVGTACIALKALAYTPMPHLQARRYPNCWYRPIDEPDLALQALRFALAEGVSSVLPPSDAGLYRMALALARRITPLTGEERQSLLDSARGLKPIMKCSQKQ